MSAVAPKAPSTTRATLALHLVMLASVADLSGVDVGGATVRLGWIVLPLAYLLVRRSRHDGFWFALTCLLFSSQVLAAMVSDSPLKGLVYAGWTFFTYFMFFRIGVDAARQLGHRIFPAILFNGRLQIVLALVFAAVGLQERPHFTYYEPSYMAIGLVPYIFATLFIPGRRRLLDYALLCTLLLTTFSANLVLMFIVAFVMWLVVNGPTLKTISLLVAIPLVAGLLFKAAIDDPLNANYNIATFIAKNGISLDLVTAALERGGNRTQRIEAGYDIAVANPWFGIGPGQYNSYTRDINFDYLSGGAWWLDPAGMPAINVLIEAAATTGVLSLVPLVLAALALCVMVTRIPWQPARLAALGSVVAFCVALSMESNFLRAYVWLAFGLYVGLVPLRGQKQTDKVSQRTAVALESPPPAAPQSDPPLSITR